MNAKARKNAKGSARSRSRREPSYEGRPLSGLRRRTWWPAKINWIVLLTFLLVVIGGFQVWSFVQSERAFLSVSSISFAAGLEANKPIRLLVSIKNGGETTAFIEAFNLTATFTTPGLNSLRPTPRYEEGAEELGPGSVVAGATAHVRVSLRKVYDAFRMGLITSGERTMHIYGFVAYRDAYSIFGDKITGYCFAYKPTPSPHFDSCKERNYTYAH